MHKKIKSVDVFLFERPRDQPYLGSGEEEVQLGEHYVVRKFNGTVYPLIDRSIVVRITDADGVEGWGETYGLIAPKAIAALINDLFGPYLIALDPMKPDVAWDALYDLQRVRGYWGGYLADALAALDIALWDLYSKSLGQSVQTALGGGGHGRLSGYVSGLPGSSKAGRLEMAQSWKDKGFDGVKIPISHSDDGDVVGEVESLRVGLGDDHKIAVDMHWTHSAQSAIALDAALQPFNPWFLEAPVKPEDIAAQEAVCEGINAPLALGEEWRTEWDYLARQNACQIVQPEMGHTGITQFMRIAKMANANSAQIIPHATIGLGIFMSASLRASFASGAVAHEYQHTIYDRNAALLEGAAVCEKGYFEIPDTPGIGISLQADAFNYLTKLND